MEKKRGRRLPVLIKEIDAKGVLTKSKLPRSDYCINPYVGCEHACLYCYARFMRRFTGHTEPWGEFVDVKKNSGVLLEQQLGRMRSTKGAILLGSVTDAYQPAERKHKITRAILKALLESDSKFHVSILTKSALVLRDVDLLCQFRSCSVGLTITTTNEAARKLLEPRAAKVSRRMEALRELRESGISTYTFIGPIIPGITDLESIFAHLGPDLGTVWGEALNPSAGALDRLVEALGKRFPDSVTLMQKVARDADYWARIENSLSALCEDYEVPLAGFFAHGRDSAE